MRPAVIKLVLAAVATSTLAACGSGGTKTIVVETTTPTATTTVTKYKMPVSATPTTCTVYLSGADALIEWASSSFDVTTACQNWISLNAKQGELWTEQIPASGVAADDTQICSLANAGGSVTASVLDDGGQVDGKGACEGLISAGWVEQNTSPTPVSRARPAAGSPKLVVTGPGDAPTFSGIEPSAIDFSGDGGNVITDIVWTSWTLAQAVGQGVSDLQSCVPNCAQGTETQVDATITLLDPEAGHFTQIIELRNGLTSDGSYGTPGWPLSAAMTSPG